MFPYGSDLFFKRTGSSHLFLIEITMKRFLFLLLFLTGLQSIHAAGFPKLSNDTEEYWYYMKFTQGAFIIASNGDGVVCKALIPIAKNAQLWKVEGSSSQGYTFTNKLGLRLYVSATSQGSEVRAAAAPPSLDRFKITASGSHFTISPSSNADQAFNVWGGMGLRNDTKLYKTSDANAPMDFVTVEDMVVKGAEINVVPYPSSLTMGEGKLDLHALTAVTVPTTTIDAPKGASEGISVTTLAQRLSEDLQRAAGISLPVMASDDPASGQIALTLDESLSTDAYKLTITADAITVVAAEYGGFFNALQTLRQLMPAAIIGESPNGGAAETATWAVPCLTIDDAPAMSHRGFHFDISRHYFNKEEVKKLLDMASVYKLNRFHWHLTDDQGWRVEIPEYPKLTTIGAIRKASLSVCDQSGDRFFDDTEYGQGCYYTLDDLREVVAYAAERNIQIIPEIDMPGHMTACIVAYPELGCNPEKKIEVMTEGGVSRDILNLGKDETIDFLKCVLGHLAEVFPYELFHLGGDECPTAAWQSNADCKRRIQDEGLSGVDELQQWLVEKLGTFLRDNYGKNVVVWDELLAHWRSSNTMHPVVMSWRGVEYASQAADKGCYSIMVPTSPLYFDYMQVNRDQLEIDCPYNAPYGTINTVERVYNFDPRSTVAGREHFVIGTQANLWTESCTSLREAEYQYYPRLLALSEIAWLPTSKKNFLGFYGRLQHHAAVLQAKNITYAPHYFEPADLPPAGQAIAEAEDILAQSNPGAVGYPEVAQADALRAALDNLRSNPDDASAFSALNAQLAAYKSAPIVLPQADRFYKIVSASTYYRYRFNGSSLYVKDNALAMHYTQQTDMEELWQFKLQDDGSYQIVSVMTGNAINVPNTSSGTVKVDNATGSNVVIRKATKPASTYTYIPGVVNIKRGRYNLYAKLSGRDLTFVASLDSSLCYPGTWRIEEVTDYGLWMEKIVEKAERILEESEPGAIGQPTEEAIAFLETDVLAKAREKLSQGSVTQQDYLDIAEKFAQFKAIPLTSVLSQMDLDYYYLIRNAYFDTYYATVNPNTNGVLPKTFTDNDNFRWHISKNDDGTVLIINKTTETAAYVASDAEEQRLRVGQNYPWKLDLVTTDQGGTGIAIINRTGAYSWYTNPRSWTYLLLKPYDWGASIWEFIKTDEQVTTGIRSMENAQGKKGNEAGAMYDLTGRRLSKVPVHGIYIQDGQKRCR